MTSYTIDASLDVAASSTFPETFPFFFGPIGTGTRDAVVNANQSVTANTTGVIHLATHIAASEAFAASFVTNILAEWGANTSESLTAIVAASAGIDWLADASLLCTVTSSGGTGFQYLADVSLNVISTESVLGVRNQFCNAPQSITSGRSAQMTAAWVTNTSLATTSNPTVAATRNRFVDASLAVTDVISAHLGASFVTQSHLAETAATSSSVKWHALSSTLLSATMASSVVIGQAYYADASLDVSIYATFPYIFPFVFEQSFDTMGKGQYIVANLAATVTKSAGAVRNRFADSSQNVLATFSVLTLVGLDRAADVPLLIAANTDATMSRNQYLNTSQEITTQADAQVSWSALAQAQELDLVVGMPTLMSWLTHADTSMVVVTDMSSVINMSTMINSYFIATTLSGSAVTHNQFGSSSLNVSAASTGTIGYNATADTQLVLQALMGATVPQSTGFWPYFLR